MSHPIVDTPRQMCHSVVVASTNPVLARLRELRRERRRHVPYSLTWLAREVGVDRTLLYRWLSGERPMNPYRRYQIAGILGMDPDDVRPDPPVEQAA